MKLWSWVPKPDGVLDGSESGVLAVWLPDDGVLPAISTTPVFGHPFPRIGSGSTIVGAYGYH
ncbi:hypothetical protein D3C80_2055290 [compost metagenome]